MVNIKARGVELFHNSDAYELLENHTSGTAKKVMLSVIKHMEKDFNQIIVNGPTLDSMLKDTGLSESQIRNGVSQLKQLQLLEPTRQIRAEYIVNPTLAIKGDAKSVWNFYGSIEKTLGNKEATVMPTETVKLTGKTMDLTDEDFIQIGKFKKGVK